jgi:uncharacterized protein (DUF111 family)
MAAEPFRTLHLQAPSGLGGNLLVTALTRAGVPRLLVERLPERLKLSGFSVTWDEFGVCDGAGGQFQGTRDHLVEQVTGRIADELTRNLVAQGLEAALELGAVHDHTACDTAFDIAAFFHGLAALHWPAVQVVGPLPATTAGHRLVRTLLPHWSWDLVPVELELVTPTAAALLATYQCTQTDRLPGDARYLGSVAGRFSRQARLGPIRVWGSR